MTEAVEEIFYTDKLSFLANTVPGKFKITRGDNNLSSCYQYAVKDCEGDRLLTVKIYDKMMDLIGREYRHVVESKIS